MPKRHCYILLVDGGPSYEEQFSRLSIKEADLVYSDDIRGGKNAMPQRLSMLKQLSRGDTISVFSPGSLGYSRKDILNFMMEISIIGVGIEDMTPETKNKSIVLDGKNCLIPALFLETAGAEQRRHIMRWARKVKNRKGATGGRPIKKLSISEAEIKNKWYDKIKYPSAKKIALEAGVTERTLYSKFGPRSSNKNKRV